MSESPDILSIALRVGEALEALQVEYFLGGSVASSLQGQARFTNDIDFVVRLHLRHVKPLAERLGPDFSIDTEALTDAVKNRGSWNIFFMPAFYRIDLFIAGSEPFDAEELRRRQRVEVQSGRSIYVKSPEDTVLRKLLWYREGGGTSERQWRDVVDVLRVRAETLDKAYLDDWAKQLSLGELLSRARADAA